MTPAEACLVETAPAYGLFPVDDFILTTGAFYPLRASPTIPQALWFFRQEIIALPRCGHPLAGFDRRRYVEDDLRRWAIATVPGAAREYPALVWIGARDVLEHARLDPDSERLQTCTSSTGFATVPRIDSNRSFYDTESATFFRSRSLRLRGTATPQHFIARSIWPEDFRLALDSPLQAIPASPEAFREFVRQEPLGVVGASFATQVVWQRTPGAAQHRGGRPVIGMLLNGAQGDDDEAHAGHFALLTGRVGAQGEIHDWLVANYYTLDSESEKGILSALLPLENYLADLNSGQAWYRPSWMLVATLRDERTSVHLSSALARVFNQFYRHQFVYRHASANCAGISISILRILGWQVPVLGATSWWRAVVALPLLALKTWSLAKGKAMFDYLSEDQTRLFPAVAFEQAGADLLRLLGGTLERHLSPFEIMLRDDIEEVLLVRIPQLPSSRAWGNYPVSSVNEYQQRLPKDPSQQKIIPVDPRPFPPELSDPLSPRGKPTRSDYALALMTGGVSLLAGWMVRSLLRNRKAKAPPESRHE